MLGWAQVVWQLVSLSRGIAVTRWPLMKPPRLPRATPFHDAPPAVPPLDAAHPPAAAGRQARQAASRRAPRRPHCKVVLLLMAQHRFDERRQRGIASSASDAAEILKAGQLAVGL